MNLDRKALLDAINTIKPALASKDLVPELCHIWFDGEVALAYNDADLGMQIPCKTPFTGGIRGPLLLGLLHNSRARDVTIEPESAGFMMLKAAKMKAKLAILNIDAMNAIWEFPEPQPKKGFELTEEFGAMLKAVLISVGNDTSIPEKMGVTIILGEDMALYTTDSRSIAQGIIALPPGYKKTKSEKRIILPTAFCEQMLRLCGKQGSFLELREDCALAGNAEGLHIFARLVEITKPLDFDGVVAKHSKFPKGAKFDVPERLALALDRAMVMLEGMPGEKLEIGIEKNKLWLEAAIQGRGDFQDSVDLPEGVPQVNFKIEPDLIKRALPMVTAMVCGEEAVFLTNGKGFSYLAATAGE